MENIWKYGLVPFESDEEIIAAEEDYQAKYRRDLKQWALGAQAGDRNIIPGIYLTTNAWTPFADCGCEPKVLYDILEYNALVCALLTFLYLEKSNDRAISDLVSQQNELSVGVIESIWYDVTERYRRNKKQDYLENCLLQIAYKAKEEEPARTGKKAKTEFKIKTKPIFAPIVEVILSKKYEEFNKPDEEKVDRLFPALVKTYDTYCTKGRAVKTGHSRLAGSAPISKSISSEAKRQRWHRLCTVYERFYNEWMGMDVSSQKNKCETDSCVSEFLKELVFHHRALLMSEQDLKRASSNLKYPKEGTQTIGREVEDIAATLRCRCQIPLVFGAEQLKFRKRDIDYAFGQYLDFIKLTVMLFYEQANHNTTAACDTIRDLLKDSKYKEDSKTFEQRRDDSAIDLPEELLAKIAKAAVEGISTPDYYGKGRIAYALSPDEYFSIDTRTSNESEIHVHTVESGRKMKIAVQPMKFDPDLSVGVACFKSKEKRDLFLTAPDEIGQSVAETFGADLDQIVLAIPKDD